MEAVKLSKAQIRDLYTILSREPLDNYELLWVLESCLETPSSSVYGLGAQPWSAGLMVLHRSCVWLRLDNEMLLTALLAPLPEQSLYRFYTTNSATLDMLRRWFPLGQLSQSRLCVRNLTKTWRKRFDVSIQVEPDPVSVDGLICTFTDGDGASVAHCTVQQVVVPWHEVVSWSLDKEQDVAYWTEHVFGALTSAILAQGYPIVVRAEEDLFPILEPLGYREFKQLYYYIAAREE